MIVQVAGSSEDKEAVMEKLEKFVEMVDKREDEEIKFRLSVGEADKDKFDVTNAVSALEALEENHYQLLEENDMDWKFNDNLENLENLEWIIDEDEVEA